MDDANVGNNQTEDECSDYVTADHFILPGFSKVQAFVTIDFIS